MQSDVSLLPVSGSSVHEILENDHEIIKGLLNSLTRSATRVERMQILEQLKGVLTIHNATEENIVYPALDKVAGHKFETLKLYNETAAADIFALPNRHDAQGRRRDEIRRQGAKTHDAVFKHIEAEEKSALPHLEKGADSSEAQILLRSVREFRSAIRFTPGSVATSRAYTGEVGTPASTSSTRMR